MAASTDSRLALVCLVSAFGAVAVARFEARQHPALTPPRAGVGVPSSASRQPAVRAPARPEPRPAGAGQRIEANRATAAELELLPGVGPTLARRIVEARARARGFRTERDLLAVRGVGEKTLQKLKPFLSFSAKYVEHPADSELPLGERDALSAHPQQAGSDVATDRPGSRREIVDAEP